VGLVAFMAGLPFLVISVPGGALIDRYDRRRVLMTCQGLAAGLASLVSIDVSSGRVQPWHLLVAAFLNGSLQAMLNPAQQSLVPRESLTNAVGLMSAGTNMTRVFGPSLAGAVIGFVGTGEAFFLQAAALFVAFLLMATTKFDSAPGRSSGPLAMRDLLDGVSTMFHVTISGVCCCWRRSRISLSSPISASCRSTPRRSSGSARRDWDC
jgi:MFS family permease